MLLFFVLLLLPANVLRYTWYKETISSDHVPLNFLITFGTGEAQTKLSLLCNRLSPQMKEAWSHY